MNKEIWSWVRTFTQQSYRLVIRNYVFASMWWTEFMLPTLVDGQILAVDNLSYRFREPQRGDVIVFTKEDSQLHQVNYWWGKLFDQADRHPAEVPSYQMANFRQWHGLSKLYRLRIGGQFRSHYYK